MASNPPAGPGRLLQPSPALGSNALSFQTGNKATPTVAHQTIATIPTPPAGDYQAYVLCYVDGTTTIADEDNMELSWNGGSQVVNMISPVIVGTAVAPVPITNGPYVIGGINGVNSMIVRTAAGTPSGTAVYHALVIIIPLAI